ncbi:hypothetical protein SNEBB_004253 [Seison nebaliae]|nr:hypothetical protein SNEBB_004253 [Seison nebaliae]
MFKLFNIVLISLFLIFGVNGRPSERFLAKQTRALVHTFVDKVLSTRDTGIVVEENDSDDDDNNKDYTTVDEISDGNHSFQLKEEEKADQDDMEEIQSVNRFSHEDNRGQDHKNSDEKDQYDKNQDDKNQDYEQKKHGKGGKHSNDFKKTKKVNGKNGKEVIDVDIDIKDEDDKL